MAGLPFDFAHGPEPVEGLGVGHAKGINAAARGFQNTVPPVRKWLGRYQQQGPRNSSSAPVLPSSGGQNATCGGTAGRCYAPATAPRSPWELCLLRPCSWITFSTNQKDTM